MISHDKKTGTSNWVINEDHLIYSISTLLLIWSIQWCVSQDDRILSVMLTCPNWLSSIPPVCQSDFLHRLYVFREVSWRSKDLSFLRKSVLLRNLFFKNDIFLCWLDFKDPDKQNWPPIGALTPLPSQLQPRCVGKGSNN